MELFKKRKKAEMTAGAIGSIITLVVGVGIASLVLIFMGTLGGQTYNLAEPDIDGLSYDANFTDLAVYVDNYTYIGYAPIATDGSLLILNQSGANETLPLSGFNIDYLHGYIQIVGSEGEPMPNGSSIQAIFIVGDPEIQSHVKGSVTNAFKAQGQTAAYLPLIVLAVVITLVLALVLGMGGGLGGMGAMGGIGGAGRGGAL